MADEIGSLLVRIDAEDNASAVLARVSGSVSSLSGASAAGTKSVSGLTGAMDAGKTTAEGYRSKMADAAKAVSDKKTALDSARTAYKATTKEAEKNTTALKSQKSSVESLIRAKQSEIDALEHSNTIINKGSQAYKDNQKAIEWTKTELRDLEAQHKSITQSMDAHEASVAKASRAYETARTEVEAAEKTYAKYTSGLDAVEKAEQTAAKAANAKNWEDAGKAIKDVGDGLDSVTKPFQYAAVGAIAGGVAVSKAAMDYETAFTGVRKTLDGTPEQLEAVNGELRQMAKEIPVSAAGLADIAAIGGQLGVGAEDITKFTKTIAAMNVSTDLAGEEGAAALARIQTVTGDTMDNVDRTASAIVDLGNKTAATESEIAYMAVRMGKYGNTVGMSTADVLGYSAALSSMGIEAQLGGSAIGRTWLDIETAVNSGGDALEAYAKYAGTSAEEFAQQWSADPSGAFNGFIKGLSATENLTQAMNDLGIVNTQDQQVVMALANGYDLLTDCLTTSSTAYAENTALAKEAGAAYGTTANQIQLAKNDIVDAAISWGNVLLPEIRSGAQWVGSLAEGFGNLDDGTKRAVISGAKTAVVIGGISKATVGAVKGIGGLVEGVGQIKTALSAGGALAKFAPTLTAIGSAALPAAAGIAAVAGAAVAAKKVYDSQYYYGDDLEEQSAKITEQLQSVKELGSAAKEIEQLKLTIESDGASQEEIEQAKARLEELTAMLKEKYNLDINVNSDSIDEAINKLKNMSRQELETTAADAQQSLTSDKAKYNADSEAAQSLRAEKAELESLDGAYKDFYNGMQDLQQRRRDGSMSEIELLERANNLYDVFKNATGEKIDDGWFGEYEGFDNLSEAFDAMSEADGWIDGAKDKMSGLSDEIARADEQTAKYRETAKTVADAYAEMFKQDVESGDTSAMADDLAAMANAIKSAGLSASAYAQQTALARAGQESLNDVWAAGGETLDNYIRAYTYDMQQLGATAQETAVGASLLKNGFTELSQVPTDTLPLIEQQATSLLQTMDGMQGKSIKIDVDSGTVQVLNDTTKAVEEISGKDVSVSVTADGDVSVLDEATGKMEELGVKGAVNLRVNADGNIEVLDEAGEKIATIDGTTGEITVEGKYEGKEDIDQAQSDAAQTQDKSTNLTVSGSYNEGGIGQSIVHQGQMASVSTFLTANGSYPGQGQIAAALSHQNSLHDVDVTYTVRYSVVGTPIGNPTFAGLAAGASKQAKGTQNFPGGLAMVNDQKGIPDPRELIIDNGRAFIPQGRDVILPLTKGAKVYTARQTKRIMRNMGIPHYAEGKSNSDAFTAASDDWTHYIKTHAVTVTKELEKWNELSKEFTANIKDAEDIEERLYSLTREQREELNEQSEDYISERNFLNDWDAFGDSAIEAFDRVRDSEYAYVADMKITEKEAADYLAELGKSMYDERIENSEAWIDKQIRYNDMSVEDTKAAYDRMAAYTQEYYDNGLISYREYIEGMEELDEQRTERLLDAYNVDDNRAQRYKQMAEVFGFDEGDNLVKTIGRELDNLDKAYADGAFKGSDEDYWDKRAELLIEQRNAEFDEWQTAMDKERTLYDLWDMWDSVGGKTGWLEDYAKRLQQFHKEEKISEKEFRAEMLDVYVEYYNAQEEALDETLQAQSDYIDSVNEKYDNLINKKEDAFDMKSLNDDIAEQQRKAEIYEGAVTQRGQDVYNDAVDRLEELQHQKEIKELQQEQTKVVSGLRDDLEAAEKYKKQILNSADAHLIDINAIAQSINSGTTGTQDILRALLSAVKNINGGVIYGDTNYNITGADTSILSAFMRRGVNAISGF